MESKEIVKKLESRQAEKKSTVKDKLDLGVQVRVNAEDLGNQKKHATVSLESPEGSTWSITCDEGAYLGGEDTAPPPLAYFSAGIAFWLLTQFSRYGEIAKLNVKNISLEQVTRFSQQGSALAGTMQASALGLDLHIEIESDDAEEKVLQLIKMGKQTCYTHAALSSPVPVQTSVTWNGREIELDEE